MKQVVLVWLMLLAQAGIAACEQRTEVIVKRGGADAAAWSQTLDPAAPFSNLPLSGEFSGGESPVLETGQLLWQTSDPTGLMNNVAVAGNGSVAAAGIELNNHGLRVYDGVSGALRYELLGVDGSNSVAISHDGSRIAYANDRYLYLLGPQNATPVWTADLGAGRVGSWVGITRAGDYIVVTQASTGVDTVRAWCFAAASAVPVWEFAVSQTASGGWMGVSFSADGSRLALTGRQRIYVLNTASGNLIWNEAAFNTEHPARLSGDGRVLVTGSNAGRARAFGWDNAQNTFVQLWAYNWTGGTSNWATATGVSADGSTIAVGSLQFLSGGYAGYVAVFDTYGGGLPLWISASMGDLVGGIAIADDGLTIAAISWGFLDDSQPDIRVFEKYDSVPFYTYTHVGSPNGVAMTPDGTRIFVGGKAVHNRMFGNGGRAYLFTADLEGGAVSGTVTLAGLPDRSGVIVEAEGQHRRALTDASGNYRITHIPAGTRTIVASKLGFTTVRNPNVVVTEGGTTPNVHFVLDTIGPPVTGLAASQTLLRHVQLTWNPALLRVQREREHDRRLAVGDAALEPARGPTAASGQSAGERERWTLRTPLDELDEPDSIRIWRGATAGGPYMPIATVAGSRVSYSDSFRVFPTYAYYYVLTAVFAGGASAYSNEALGRLNDAYLVFDPIVPPLSVPVTFDGVLSPGEWADAVRIDISDVFGYDAPDPPQTAFLYMKYDDANDRLLMACEDFANPTLDDGEGFGIYVDDDDSDTWSYHRSGSEGNYWAYYYAAGSTLRYRSLSGAPYNASPYFTFENPSLGFSAAAGHLTGELAVPLGFHELYELALYGPDKTPGIGFFVIRREAGNPLFDGWWPQNIPSIVSNPEFFSNSSVQANLTVPPASPRNVTVSRDGATLALLWDAPTHGIDDLPLTDFDGIYIHRNGDLLRIVPPTAVMINDSNVEYGGWYEYSLAGFVAEDTQDFLGPFSVPVGAYAGAEPEIEMLVQDDGSWEAWTLVDFAYNGNRFAQRCEMPATRTLVYTVELAANQIGPIGIGVAADNAGLPGGVLAGPYFITTPATQQFFTFHIPGREQPDINGVFWITLDWTSDSPGNPAFGTDVNGPRYNNSYWFTTSAGWTQYSSNWMIRAGVGDVVSDAGDSPDAVAQQFRLLPNYPNPFNARTTIPFELSAEGRAELAVFNLLGQRVATLVSGAQPAGYHVAQWDGAADTGGAAASGLYWVRLTTDRQTAIHKIMLMR